MTMTKGEHDYHDESKQHVKAHANPPALTALVVKMKMKMNPTTMTTKLFQLQLLS